MRALLMPTRLALACLMLGALAPAAALADSIKEAKSADIAMLLDAASGENSAYLATLIGETRGRVYIEYVPAIHAGSLFSKRPKRIVYWLPRSGITDEQLARFRSYQQKLRVLDGLGPPAAK